MPEYSGSAPDPGKADTIKAYCMIPEPFLFG